MTDDCAEVEVPITAFRRELIWLGIVSVSYLDDRKGTFMFHLPEKFLAIHLASTLLEKSNQQYLDVEEIIGKYEIKYQLEAVRSGSHRGRDGPSVCRAFLAHYASKNLRELLTERLKECSTEHYHHDDMLKCLDVFLQSDKDFCNKVSLVTGLHVGPKRIGVTSELSIVFLRLLSSRMYGGPLSEQEVDRVHAEGIQWENSFNLDDIISAINDHRILMEKTGFEVMVGRLSPIPLSNPVDLNQLPIPPTFASIHYHIEGAKRTLPLWRKLAARMYVVFALVMSVLTAALNFGKRPTAFERITDGLGVATALLITVFGLLKLTSEDPNAIRNSLLGIKVLKTAEDVARECGCGNIETLKNVMSVVDYPIPWASDQQTSYLKHSPTGLMVVPGGLSVGPQGFAHAHTFGNRLIAQGSPFGMLITSSSPGTARATRTDVKLPYVTVFPTKVVKVI